MMTKIMTDYVVYWYCIAMFLLIVAMFEDDD